MMRQPMTKEQAAGLTSGRAWNAPATFFRFWMPYCFQRVDHPTRKHVFIPLNRDYVPLGILDRPTVDYPAQVDRYGVAFTRDPATFEGIWWNTDGSSRLWLYDDTAASRFDYFARLEALMLRGCDLAATPRHLASGVR